MILFSRPFLLAYPYIVERLEVIAHKLHLAKYPNWGTWDSESRSRASSLLSGFANFHFFIVWTTIVKAISYLRGPTEKIQGRSLDLYDVVSQVQQARDDLEYVRKNCENGFFKRCFDYASNIASLVSMPPSKLSHQVSYHTK